jgi:replicative DNA helicase
VYAIGALKKTGKSRFGVYLSCVLKSQGAGIFWNSLEMSAGQLNILATAYFSDLNSNVFMKWMKPADYDRFKIGINSLKFLDWSIYKCHYVNDLRSRILSERQHKNIDIVFVDFIQRMRSLKHPNDRVREVEDLSKELADLSRDLNVAVIEFSQLTGAAEKLDEGMIPDMSHFKESQGTTENADTIMILHNLDRNKITDKINGYQPQNFKIRIDQRYDLSGEIIDIKADLRTCKFFE